MAFADHNAAFRPTERGAARYLARRANSSAPNATRPGRTILTQRPAVERYARRTGCTIPVALLEPLE